MVQFDSNIGAFQLQGLFGPIDPLSVPDSSCYLPYFPYNRPILTAFWKFCPPPLKRDPCERPSFHLKYTSIKLSLFIKPNWLIHQKLRTKQDKNLILLQVCKKILILYSVNDRKYIGRNCSDLQGNNREVQENHKKVIIIFGKEKKKPYFCDL